MTQQKTTARMYGFIRAVADQAHPLQTRLSLILTDFEPNRNRQAVPLAEAENIVRTALHTPLKINFDGAEYYGHKGAIPIGPIISAYEDEDNGRKVIAAEAVIWNDIYEDVADHLKVAFAEGVGTSWEIYYDTEKTTKDENDIEWLGGCVFAGTCVVETPAYGPNRTRLLAIAEKLSERADSIQEKIIMAQADKTTKELETNNLTNADVVKTTAVASDTLTTDISDAMGIFSKLYEGLWNMLEEADQLERELATTDISTVAEQFSKAIVSIEKRFNALKDKAAKAETVEAELTELKDGIAKAETEKAEAEKIETRKVSLAGLGIDFDAKKDFYLEMSDEMFTKYVEDLRLVKGNKTVAESKPIIPEPTNSTGTLTISTKELAALIRGDK